MIIRNPNQFEISWGVHKEFKLIVEALNAKVPNSGEIKGSKNKALEKFRKAQNVIYDIFNNGLINRGRELKVLGLVRNDLSFDTDIVTADWDYNNRVTWEAFKPIILNAVAEQL